MAENNLRTGHKLVYLFKQKGRHTWQIRWWADGVKRQTSTGTADRAKAELVLLSMRMAVRGQAAEDTVERLLRAAFPGRASAGIDLDEAIAEYQRERGNTHRAQLVVWRWKAFCRWVAACRPGIRTLQAIDPACTRAFAESLVDRASGTRAGIVHACAAFYRVVAPLHSIVADPWKGIRVPVVTSARRDLTQDECRALIGAATGDYRLALVIGIFTGLRYGDIAHLSWDQVDGGCIRIEPSKTKRRGTRVSIPLHPDILDALPPRATGYIMPELARTYGKTHYATRFADLCTAAGIDSAGISFHSLRHTFITRLAEAHVPREVRMRLAGHSSADTHDDYTHDAVAQRRAVEALPRIAR